MSLIDDALKRAREQAKADPSGRTGRRPPDPWEYAPLPDRRRRTVAWPVAVLVILAAAVAGILAVRRERTDKKVAGSSIPTALPLSRRGELPAPPMPLSSDPSRGGEERNPAAAWNPSTRIGEVRSGPDGAPPVAPAASSATAAPAAAREARPPTIPPPSVVRIASASGSPQIRSDAGAGVHAPAGRSFVGSLVAPGGGRVELGGIVFSDTNPAALLNGRVLPVGGVVEGLTIVRIEESRVELEGGDGATFFLLLR